MRSLSEGLSCGGGARAGVRRRRAEALGRASARAAARRALRPRQRLLDALSARRRAGSALALAGALMLRRSPSARVRGGQYQAFVAAQGGVGDFLARTGRLRRQRGDDLRASPGSTSAKCSTLAGIIAEELAAVLRRRRGARRARKGAAGGERRAFASSIPDRLVIDIVERGAGGAVAARRRSQHRRGRRRRARRIEGRPAQRSAVRGRRGRQQAAAGISGAARRGARSCKAKIEAGRVRRRAALEPAA